MQQKKVLNSCVTYIFCPLLTRTRVLPIHQRCNLKATKKNHFILFINMITWDSLTNLISTYGYISFYPWVVLCETLSLKSILKMSFKFHLFILVLPEIIFCHEALNLSFAWREILWEKRTTQPPLGNEIELCLYYPG